MPRDGVALFEDGKANGSTYATPGRAVDSGEHLDNTCSMRNEKDEVKGLDLSQSYNITSISETWWDKPHGFSTRMESCQQLRRDRQGGQGGGVAMQVRKRSDCEAIAVRGDVEESLWVRIKNKADVVGVFYPLPTRDDGTDELGEIL